MGIHAAFFLNIDSIVLHGISKRSFEHQRSHPIFHEWWEKIMAAGHKKNIVILDDKYKFLEQEVNTEKETSAH